MNVKQILTRIYVNDINSAIPFYEKLIKEKCESRFIYKEVGLEIARISNLLIIGGSDQALVPFRNSSVTILVDSIEEYKYFLLQNSTTILRDIQKVPTGYNMIVKHNDGTVVEYVEHTK